MKLFFALSFFLFNNTFSYADNLEGGFGTRGGGDGGFIRVNDSCVCIDNQLRNVTLFCETEGGCKIEELCQDLGFSVPQEK